MNGKRTTHKLKTLARFSKPNTIWPAIDSISTKRNYLRRDIKCLKVTHKVAYISAIAILVTVLGTQVNRCAIHFWSAPTYFATTFVPQQKALFPSLTICPFLYHSSIQSVSAENNYTFDDLIKLPPLRDGLQIDLHSVVPYKPM